MFKMSQKIAILNSLPPPEQKKIRFFTLESNLDLVYAKIMYTRLCAYTECHYSYLPNKWLNGVVFRNRYEIVNPSRRLLTHGYFFQQCPQLRRITVSVTKDINTNLKFNSDTIQNRLCQRLIVFALANISIELI